MSIFEYDKEEEEKKLRRAEFKAGYENGFENGFDAGELSNMKKIIQLMLKTGEPVNKIAQYTDCTVEEVKNIIKDFQ